MGLPEIKTPKHKLKLPGLKKEIHFRPFLVKDQKVLMLSKESNKPEEMYDLAVDLIKECTFGEFDPLKMPVFDLEYLFINMKAKSGGEELTLKYSYKEDRNNPEEVAQEIKITINLEDVQVKNIKHKIEDIEVSDGVFIKLKYPTVADMKKSASSNVELLASCIDYIYQKGSDEIHEADDIDREELLDWIGSLPSEGVESISNFFKDMPRLEHTIEIPLPNGKTVEKTLRGLTDFFG